MKFFPSTDVVKLDLKYVTTDELTQVVSRKFVSVTKKSGAFHGLAIWFNVSFSNNLYEDSEHWQNSILSTGPEADPTHWKQTVIPLFGSTGTAPEVEEDEIIGWELSLKKIQGDPLLTAKFKIYFTLTCRVALAIIIFSLS